MYSIQIAASAYRDYKKIPKEKLAKINSAIDGLKINPRPNGCKKLKNRDAYRVRADDYRIIYEIHEKILIILVIRIRHRKEVYRRL